MEILYMQFLYQPHINISKFSNTLYICYMLCNISLVITDFDSELFILNPTFDTKTVLKKDNLSSKRYTEFGSFVNYIYIYIV